MKADIINPPTRHTVIKYEKQSWCVFVSPIFSNKIFQLETYKRKNYSHPSGNSWLMAELCYDLANIDGALQTHHTHFLFCKIILVFLWILYYIIFHVYLAMLETTKVYPEFPTVNLRWFLYKYNFIYSLDGTQEGNLNFFIWQSCFFTNCETLKHFSFIFISSSRISKSIS